MAEFYVMTKNARGQLYLKMDNMECYPASDWADAREGVVKGPEIVDTIDDVKGGMVAVVRGHMVETAEFDIDELIDLCPNDVTVYTDFAVITKYNRNPGEYCVKTKEYGLVPVSYDWGQKHYHNEEQQKQFMKRIAQRLAERYSVKESRKRMEFLIRNFAVKDLHCASHVTVYDDCMFEVLYPGAYRDSCSQFVFDEQGDYVNMSAVRFAGEYLYKEQCEIQRRTIALSDIVLEMDKLGIAVGEDSGDEVPGILPEERKYLSTYKLPGGSVLVMFKAEEFRYELLQNERLTSVVCTELCKWMHNLGGYNEYISWID